LLGAGGASIAVDALRLHDLIDAEESSVPKIEIYTKWTCGFCSRAKKLLDMKKLAYDEISVDMGGERRAEMIERSNGRTTVPQIFINGKHIGGCDALMALEYDGKLDELVAA
jgi:glutaredoxin 3